MGKRQRYFVVILSLFSLVLLLMSLQTGVKLTQANDTHAQLVSALADAQRENAVLEAQFETMHSLAEIEQYARSVLGMTGRGEAQTEYINES